MRLIGLHGPAGAGKDTVAEILGRKYGFVRIGLADALKEEVATRLRRTLTEVLILYNAFLDEKGGMRYANEAALLAEKPPIIRALLQEYGTEVRRADEPLYWTVRWLKRVDEARQAGATAVVAPDVRFSNEVTALRQRGGWLFFVERPGVDYQGTHASDQKLTVIPDAVIVNDGTLDDLDTKVHAAMLSVGVMGSADPGLPLASGSLDEIRDLIRRAAIGARGAWPSLDGWQAILKWADLDKEANT